MSVTNGSRILKVLTPRGEVGCGGTPIVRTRRGCGWLVVAGIPTGAAVPAHAR
jgi:hypothetical protein